MAAAAAAKEQEQEQEGEEEFTAEEVEVAAILCNLKKNLRARERRWRRRMQRRLLVPAAAAAAAAPEIPSWGRRRPRSMPEEKAAAAAAPAPAPAPASGVVAERDGAASPDTPLALAYPESGGDDAPAAEGEEDDAKKPAASHDQWVHEQQGVVASLSQQNAHLLKFQGGDGSRPTTTDSPTGSSSSHTDPNRAGLCAPLFSGPGRLCIPRSI